MDPEPSRCRRTDGKKWRCSKDVVPDQKYCERHMHRGRQRSRKHVEASLITSESSRTLTFKNTIATINSSDSANTKTSHSSNTSNNTVAATASSTSFINGINGSENKVVSKKDSTATTTTQTTRSSNIESSKNVYGNKDSTTTTTGLTSVAAANNSNKQSNNDSTDGKHGSCRIKIKIKGSGNNINNCKAGSFVAPEFGFSPKSVLQVAGHSNSCIDYRNAVETESQRCKRTDGKKWRCGRDVVPDQKYCGQHMYRGAKKLVVVSQLVTVSTAAPPTTGVCHVPPLAIPKKADGDVNLNTNLSISITSSPLENNSDERNSWS